MYKKLNINRAGAKKHLMKCGRADSSAFQMKEGSPGFFASPTKKLDKSKMACNKPKKSPKPQKKKVVKACEGGKEKIIHYGHTSYGHNYSAAARKSFRARHGCDKKKSKLTASYWACKDLWAGKGGSTKSNPKNVRGKY
jgi:hypothetical protein